MIYIHVCLPISVFWICRPIKPDWLVKYDLTVSCTVCVSYTQLLYDIYEVNRTLGGSGLE